MSDLLYGRSPDIVEVGPILVLIGFGYRDRGGAVPHGEAQQRLRGAKQRLSAREPHAVGRMSVNELK